MKLEKHAWKAIYSLRNSGSVGIEGGIWGDHVEEKTSTVFSITWERGKKILRQTVRQLRNDYI